MLRLMASALLAAEDRALSISPGAVRLRDRRQQPKESIMSKKIQAIPDGMHSVTPHLVCAGAAQAIEFYKKAFGATDEGRLPGPDGRIMHAQIRINGSVVMLVDEMPEMGAFGPKALKGSPVTIHLYVDDVDAVVERAVQAGARVTMPVADQFWGDRYGQLEDPFGHHWSVGTHQREVSMDEMQAAMRKMAAPAHA
jgi:PhnB protein